MASSTRLDRDTPIRRTLERQLDVISRQQALTAGLTRHALGYRLRPGGPWRSLLPGVYMASTGTPTTIQQEMAAMLYAGSRSVITGPGALRCHHIRGTSSDLVDVLIPATRRRHDTGFVRLIALDPAVVVPGHGEVTDVSLIRDVRGYLDYVRSQASRLRASGAPADDAAAAIEQAALARWDTWANPEWIGYAARAFYQASPPLH
jgi:hypothetical protein